MGAGALAAGALLVKLNVGALTFLVGARAAWAVPPRRWRAEAVFAASFASAFLALWLATGNRVGDLGAWLRNAYEIVSGYTGQAHEQPGRGWEYAVAAPLLALLAYLVWRQTRGRRRPLRLALGAASGAVAFGYFKHGFVSHDVHATYFFSTLAVLLLAFAWRPVLRPLAAAAFATAAIAVLAAPEVSPRDLFRPVAAARSAVDHARLAFDRARADALAEGGRAFAHSQLRLDPATEAAVRGHNVHVDPYEISAAWVLAAEWRPLPVFQNYSTYTARLDRLNAEALASDRAPERILRQRLDRRLGDRGPAFESPAATVAMLCNYRQQLVAGYWQVLERIGNRCGAERVRASVRARRGERIPVPRAAEGELVLARVHPARDLVRELQSLVFKPLDDVQVVVDETRYRFVVETARNPHAVRVPATAGYAGQFGGEIDYETIRFEGGMPSPFRIEFYALPLRPA